MAEPYESISLYRKKNALAGKPDSKHVTEYELLSDDVTEDGTRTIVLKKADISAHLTLCAELANAMVERLGEGDNKLLRKMLFDTLRDFENDEISKMHRKVVLGREPVKYKEGCFKLIVGDGRRKNSHEIMLVD